MAATAPAIRESLRLEMTSERDRALALKNEAPRAVGTAGDMAQHSTGEAETKGTLRLAESRSRTIRFTRGRTEADLQLIQEALGHEDLGTTTIYAHVSSTKQRADIARYLEGLGEVTDAHTLDFLMKGFIPGGTWRW